jgi:hypothetical protein
MRYFIEKHYSGGKLMDPGEWDMPKGVLSKPYGAASEPNWLAPLGAGANGRHLGSFDTVAQLKEVDPTGFPEWTWVSVRHPHRLAAAMQTGKRNYRWSPGSTKADDVELYDMPNCIAPSGAGAALGRWIWI